MRININSNGDFEIPQEKPAFQVRKSRSSFNNGAGRKVLVNLFSSCLDAATRRITNSPVLNH